ncbi:MAG: hypothetical protein JSU07_04690 [Bacteroidetes bacterium]|nr:hypothetical protein [Bacteroidota bacterium]
MVFIIFLALLKRSYLWAITSADMRKAMSFVSKILPRKADNKIISVVVKQLLGA